MAVPSQKKGLPDVSIRTADALANKTASAKTRAATKEIPDAGANVNPKEARRARLIAEAAANPSAFFSFEETGIIFGFGDNVMTALVGAGAPQVFRRMNPPMVLRWIEHNQEQIKRLKLGADGGRA